MTVRILTFILSASLLAWSIFVSADTINAMQIPITLNDGRTISLSQLAGEKPVYLKFWASWCQPCREQMAHLQQTYEKYGEQIEVISINLGINDGNKEVLATKEEFGLTVPISVDKDAILAQSFALIATPYHILLDKNANIVHKGHDVTDELNRKIALLATTQDAGLEKLTLKEQSDPDIGISSNPSQPTVLFFSSAWCDWYLKDSRPSMSANCINAQEFVNTASGQNTQINWQGILTRLWTGEKELAEYRDKFNIQYPLTVDSSNTTFYDYNVKYFPTLIAIQNGKEVLRVLDFSDQKSILALRQWIENF